MSKEKVKEFKKTSGFEGPVVDPGGAEPPPSPPLNLVKKDGHHAGPQVSLVTAPFPHPDEFLDLLLRTNQNLQNFML